MAKKSREKKRKADAAKKAEPVKAVAPSSPKKTCCRHAPKQIFLAIAVLAAVALISWYAGSMMSGSGPADAGDDVVGDKVVSFLQSRLAVSYPGIEVELAGVEDYPNMTDTYEVMVSITYQGRTQELPYYASKDGKQLFTIIGDLDEVIEASAPATPSENTGDLCSQLGITKSEKPSVEVFIMSYCPYGLQMQKAVLPVMTLLGGKADMEIKWVYYIMHGQKEIDENNIQECIKTVYPDKYIDYATCFTVSGTSDECLTQVGIDSATIDTCIAALDTEFRISELYADQSTWLSGNYPLYNVHAEDNAKYSVGGSPTTVINGKVVSVSRSPEAVKQAVCCAFTNPPPECDTVLSTASASAGIGGGAGADTAATC
ncbi:MAG: hypothetical protein JW789_04530 [Candidatus Aenigmarchaeota archaeon]|nr:hypothetical protein [Candidatus Aenigmarchaeota archaeon]